MFLEKQDFGLITIYGGDHTSAIAKQISSLVNNRDLRILTPSDPETLLQAAQNSVVIFVTIEHDTDPNFQTVKSLKDNRMVVADIVALTSSDLQSKAIESLAKGFDSVVERSDMDELEFKKFLQHKITKGTQRLSGLIQEEEYRRLSDALSNAPASMMVFDKDKRAAFISDHYYRAYPKIAPRLAKGLSVYDAFEMMMKEEGIPPNDDRYARLRQFWHNLKGSIEFRVDSGTHYRLKAVDLPSNRGTVVTGQNISDYETRKTKLEEKNRNIQDEMTQLKQTAETKKQLLIGIDKELQSIVKDLDGFQNGDQEKIETCERAVKKLDSLQVKIHSFNEKTAKNTSSMS